MNKNLRKLSLVALLVAVAGTFACKKSDDPAPSSDSGVVTLQGDLTGTTNLTADKKYLLKGFVYVPSGSTINIAAGTVITGQVQAALIIEPGGKINAIGTASNPIVFTSSASAGTRARGNWGGLVLAGNAYVNTATPTSKPLCEGGIRTYYGNDISAPSTVDNDNSGTLKYVRIEYAGYAPIPGSELNGLTFSGVGDGTTIEYVQTSYANDDGMEWFGGSVNAKHVINFAAIDDDYDTDCGFHGKVQFGLAARAQYESDQSGSKAFESDHDANAGVNQPSTSCQFVNMTLVGPVVSLKDATNGNKPAKIAATYIGGVHIRRNSSLSLHNAVVIAWNNGIMIDGKPGASGVTTANLSAGGVTSGSANGDLRLQNILIAGISKNIPAGTGTADNRLYDVLAVNNGAGDLTTINVADSAALTWPSGFTGPNKWFYQASNNNRYQADYAGILNMNLATAWSTMTFDFTPATGSPALTGASFTNVKNTSGFFDTTPNYVGAFSLGDSWHTGWSNFNPQVVNY